MIHGVVQKELKVIPDERGRVMEILREVTDYREPTPLPGCPPHIPGLMNLRGHALPLLDLGVFLDLGEPDAAAPRRVLVVAAEGMRVGLLADRILGVVRVPAEDIADIRLAQNRRLIDFSRGELETSERTLVVLAMDKLLTSAQATG